MVAPDQGLSEGAEDMTQQKAAKDITMRRRRYSSSTVTAHSYANLVTAQTVRRCRRHGFP